MPRAARKKEPADIYHAMSRSITEFDLFPDNSDKEAFLDMLQKYIEKYHCKIYAYCLMTNKKACRMVQDRKHRRDNAPMETKYDGF